MLLQPPVFHKHPTSPLQRCICLVLPPAFQKACCIHPHHWLILLCAALFLGFASSVYARPIAWIQGDLALAKRHAAGRLPLLLQVSAAWCTPCNQLHREVLDTPAMLPFLQRAVGVRFDFDTPQGQQITRRYAILDLPTILLLDEKGQEIGRIQGYNGTSAYLRRLHALFQGHSDLLSLQALRAKRPLAPNEQIRLARALLVRGQSQKAYDLLRTFLFQPSSVGQDATQIWGRWLLRVQKRPIQAEQHFRRAAQTYQQTPAFGGFLYWQANSLHQQNKTHQAIALFTQWAQRTPHDSLPPMLLADFLLHHNLSPQQAHHAIQQAHKRLSLASPLFKKRAPWLFYLSAQYHQRLGHLQPARRAIQQAIHLAPHTAIYQNFAQTLTPRASSRPSSNLPPHTPRTQHTPRP